MNSQIIKFVAGAGKTTFAENYMKNNKNGIYLAFNNSVVDDLKNKGYLCKTIDSLFTSYIIPKFTSLIPIIANGSKINYVDGDNLKQYQRGFANIKIHKNGEIYNKNKKTNISLDVNNKTLYEIGRFKNDTLIKFIFSKKQLNLNDQLRAELSDYIIEKYQKELIEILESRFSYIIIDEAQDLKFYRENFAKIIFDSNLKLIILGDDNQNINGGGKWFESLKPDMIKNRTYRCTEKICEWIRNNLNIEIYGNSNEGEYTKVDISDVLNYDDGKRVLLYIKKTEQNKNIINNWKGEKLTIRKAKGSTIDEDIVIVGNTLNNKNMYTAVTRTTKNCYSTIKI